MASPDVQTHPTKGSRAMPLDTFIVETTQILESQPGSGEVIVGHCRWWGEPLRFVAERGAYTSTFEGLNEAMAGRGT